MSGSIQKDLTYTDLNNLKVLFHSQALQYIQGSLKNQKYVQKQYDRF